jgi:hypothetical protein
MGCQAMQGLLACPMLTRKVTTDFITLNRNFFTDVTSEVLKLVRTMMFFQVVTLCRLVGRYHRLGETYCVHIQRSSHGLYL